MTLDQHEWMSERDPKVDGAGAFQARGTACAKWVCAGDNEVGVSNPSNDGNIWTELEDLKGRVKSNGAASLSDWDF